MNKEETVYQKLADFITDYGVKKKYFYLSTLGQLLNTPKGEYTGKDIVKAIDVYPTECLEQAFCEIVEKIYLHARKDLAQECIDDLVTPLDGELSFDNYFPSEEKQINNPTWIMINTDRGKRIVLAKRARNYGVNFRDRLHKAKLALDRFIRDSVKEMQDFPALFDTKKYNTKERKLTYEFYKQLLISTFEKPPYYVVYNRTRTRKEYLLPHQYNVIDDETLNKYVDWSIGKSKAIKLKPLWTAINKDQIFYLESRGISKDRAIALAMLNQCYIDIDIKMLIDEEREANKHLLVGVA
jgi:hypothetical protein